MWLWTETVDDLSEEMMGIQLFCLENKKLQLQNQEGQILVSCLTIMDL